MQSKGRQRDKEECAGAIGSEREGKKGRVKQGTRR